MKRIIVSVCLLCSFLCIEAQSKKTTKLIKNLNAYQEIGHQSFSHDAISFAKLMTGQSPALNRLIDQVDHATLMTIGESRKADVKRELNSCFKQGYQTIQLKDQPSNMTIHIRKCLWVIRECHVYYIGSKKDQLFSVYGKFTYGQVKAAKPELSKLKGLAKYLNP